MEIGTETEDRVLVPQRKVPCETCGGVTIHVHIADKLLCLTCGEPFESSQLAVREFRADLLLRALGSTSALRVLRALADLGEAYVRGIGRAAHISSPSAIQRALHRLYEADLVSRRNVPVGVRVGRVRHHWSLNRGHPTMTKLLELLAEVTV